MCVSNAQQAPNVHSPLPYATMAHAEYAREVPSVQLPTLVLDPPVIPMVNATDASLLQTVHLIKHAPTTNVSSAHLMHNVLQQLLLSVSMVSVPNVLPMLTV
jgi:hypothetical protein